MRKNLSTVLVLSLMVTVNAAYGQGVEGLTDEIGTQFQAYITLAIQLLAAAAFLIVGYGVITKFVGAVSGRAEWGEVVLPVVFGAMVLIISAYMFTEAQTLADAIGG